PPPIPALLLGGAAGRPSSVAGGPDPSFRPLGGTTWPRQHTIVVSGASGRPTSPRSPRAAPSDAARGPAAAAAPQPASPQPQQPRVQPQPSAPAASPASAPSDAPAASAAAAAAAAAAPAVLFTVQALYAYTARNEAEQSLEVGRWYKVSLTEPTGQW